MCHAADDEDDWGAGCIGQGAISDLARTSRGRKACTQPIGFVHFKEAAEKKTKRVRAQGRAHGKAQSRRSKQR